MHLTALAKRGDLEFKNHYLIGNKICQMKHGEVRKILRKGTDRRRAVKIYNKKNMQEKDIVRLNREIEILEDVNHPNIIRIFETYGDLNEPVTSPNHNKQYFVVTELCTGGQLYEEIIYR